MSEIDEMLKIADIHANRINMALNKLSATLPFTAEKVQSFTEQELLWTDLLVNRFAKLQDFLGIKLINYFLTYVGEFIDGLTMIDKINVLERLHIIKDAKTWQHMRTVGNHVSHEYPDNPELKATYLNDLVRLSPELLQILINIKNKLLESNQICSEKKP